MILRLKRKLTTIRKRFFFDIGGDRQSVFLAGTGRSGTTWIEEVINHDNAYRIMFEPFHSRKVSFLRDWNYRQYIRPDDKNDKYLIPARTILGGKMKNEWVDSFNRKFISNKRLIKDIRSNLYLKWITNNFPEIPVILLLRHPCAVANSKLKLNWDTHLEDFLVQDELMEDFLDPFKKEIENARESFDKHIFMWCIENFIPLKQFNHGEILVCFYENLCVNPKKGVETLLPYIGDHFSSSAFERSQKPSALSRKDSPIINGADLVGSWRDSINDDRIARAMEILRLFGLDTIYSEGSMPLISETKVLDVLHL